MTQQRTQLARRLASANESLRSAQREGNYTAIVAWLEERDRLLDELWPSKVPDPKKLQLALEDTN